MPTPQLAHEDLLMNRLFSLFVIGLLFGGGIGFTIAAGNGITFDGHDHANPAHHGAGMDHGDEAHAMMHETPLEVPAEDAPQLSIMLYTDPMAGWNLHIMTDNFAFSPQHASLENITGEGHAHVYINGQKRGRVYGAWTHLDTLPKGEVEVRVSLNTNDHRPLAVDGIAIEAAQTIMVD